jgi:hypothetical protein
MQYLPFGARAAVLVLAVATAPSCASGAMDSVNDTSDANDGSSDGGGTTNTSSSGGAVSDTSSDGGAASDTSLGGGAASDTSYAFESGGGGDESIEGDDASDGTTVLGDTSTDASAGASDDAETAAPSQTGLSVLYEVQDPAAMSAYIGCELSITNSGTGSPGLSDLKARYYYTDEVQQTPQITINWSHVSTSGADEDLEVTSSVVSLVPAVTDADTYVEFSFSSNSSPALTPGESAMFSWQLQGPTPSQDIYTQTNDYSFDASTTTLTSWDHIVLLQSGTVVWGLTP